MKGVSVRKINPAEPTSLSTMKELEAMFDRIERRAFELFEQRGCAPGKEMEDWLNAEAQYVFAPPSELVESKKNVEIHVSAPGFSSDQLKVSVLPECIIVKGEMESKKERKKGTTYFSELCQKDLLRRFFLPSKIDPDQVHASLEDGMLKIVAKKVVAVAAKPVVVEAGKPVKRKTAAA